MLKEDENEEKKKHLGVRLRSGTYKAMLSLTPQTAQTQNVGPESFVGQIS